MEKTSNSSPTRWQRRITRKHLPISMCNSFLEMGQQAKSTWIFARKQVIVCFLQADATVWTEKQNTELKISSMMSSTECFAIVLEYYFSLNFTLHFFFPLLKWEIHCIFFAWVFNSKGQHLSADPTAFQARFPGPCWDSWHVLHLAGNPHLHLQPPRTPWIFVGGGRKYCQNILFSYRCTASRSTHPLLHSYYWIQPKEVNFIYTGFVG